MRFVKWLSCGVWAGSWYLMYLEITRWHHVRPTLAFNSDPVVVGGTEVTPRPGLPLRLLYVACVAAPLSAVITSAMSRRRPRDVRAPL